ncbi:hypothetical protein PG999_010227 [Apiospora kogelbergensis]|uniref:Uncharacterized protein n=1 Tax=Apiospora kogelbergensis TaxID=1337665 RepID=A0AAW0QQW8_9PEZI
MGPLQERVEQARGKQLQQRPTFTKEDYDELCKTSRLSLPPFLRIPIAAFAGFSLGMSLGLSYGSKMAGLRFRAEHAHKLPDTTAGWYMYHKSKNYHLAFGGIKEGIKTGARMGVLTAAIFCAENLFDVYRGSKDLLNTVGASLAVAGGFSLLNRFSVPETARTARKGLIFGIAYGGVQDLLSLAQGRPVGYVEFARRHLGGSTTQEEQEMA